MAERAPWFAGLVTAETLLLITGAIFLLSSIGEVSLSGFGFRLGQEAPPVGRVVLAIVGIILLLGSITIYLAKAGVWVRRLGTMYFVFSLASISAVGIAGLRRAPLEVSTDARVFKSWDASRSRVAAQIVTSALSQRSLTSNLLLVCRKHTDTIPFESDVKIQKSALFEIYANEVVQNIALDFDVDFSDTLQNGDAIECALCEVPKNASRDRIFKLADVRPEAGHVLQIVWSAICSARSSGRTNP